MIVIGPANDILDETYLVSTESRGYIQEPGESPITLPTLPPPPPPPSLLIPPIQVPSKGELGAPFLPDLIPAGHRDSRSPRPVIFATPKNPHAGRNELAVEMNSQGLAVRDLVHQSLSEPLRNQQQTSFKLVKLASDFNHQLSKIHEQFAEETAQLVEGFRKRTSDILNEGPRCSNSIAISWDHWMNDVMQDSACHSEIASVLGRAVARTLLEKTFHMKIQSRKVFSQRESYETMLAETEDILSKSHQEYRLSWTRHVEQQTPATLANYLERHNAYVQQVHATNGMLDQYYAECLPHLLQELEDVYQDVSGVVVDSLTEGANTISVKTANMNSRWAKTSEIVRQINPTQDLGSFIQSVPIPEYVPVTRHTFAPPPPKESTNEANRPSVRFQEIGLPIKTCEVVLDRVVSETARVRYENLRLEVKDVEGNIKLLNDAMETLIRIQAKNLEQQLFNKANEIQEEISRKRCELRIAQIQLAGLRAQKELFSSKVITEADPKGAVEGVPAGGPRERKLSTSSTGNIKSKWVKAFKSIKGKGDNDKGKSAPASAVPQIIENSHIFQEYTYKKITPCDVCSQILRGHSRQGLKCKLCRMNVHTDCQEKVVKCQPKSKLLRRQKSASEFESRTTTDPEDESFVSLRGSVEPMGVVPRGVEPMGGVPKGDGLLQQTASVDSGGQPSKLLTVPNERNSMEPSPTRRRMGGSYSTYTPGRTGAGIALQTDGELVDSSGRRINTSSYANGSMEVAGMADQPRHP